MAKPICVVYYNPDVFTAPNERKLPIMEVNDIFEKRFPEYYTFAFPYYQSVEGNGVEDIRFEVFNAENMDTTSLQEFKKEILETLLVT